MELTLTTAISLAVLLPLIGTVLIGMSDARPNQREAVSIITSLVLFYVVTSIVPEVMAGARPQVTWFEVMPGLSISFEVEPLGMLFALVASGLWIVTVFYCIGYMRGNNEKHQTRFYMCFAIAIAAAMGIAFSANMFTLFIFYEVLTISTYPLVAHKQNAEAKAGARTYLGILIGTSIGFQLVAIIWTWLLAGTLDFQLGGILEGKIDPALLPILLALYAFGIGKAALLPFHRWLPAAMVAPTPVSALLHAVAVVKAGVFTMLKVGLYIFGIDFLAETNASEWLVWVAAASVLIASMIAITKDNLKARLAYSTVSQLSYITLGMALATSMSAMGGALHIAMHAAGKITLFFCAGAIYTATKKTNISDMDGLGKRMPFTMFAFFLGALCVIGVPPLGGVWSKWHLVAGAYTSGEIVIVLVLMISTLLNIAYLLPPVVRAFMLPANDGYTGGIKEAPLACVVPLCMTALLCVGLFFYAEAIVALLSALFQTSAGVTT